MDPIPHGLRLVRQATYLPECVLGAWWRENLPQVNARDESGRTALWWAAAEGDSASVRALMQLGADPALAGHHCTTCTRLAASGGR